MDNPKQITSRQITRKGEHTRKGRDQEPWRILGRELESAWQKFLRGLKKALDLFSKAFNSLLALFFGVSLLGVLIWWFWAAVVWPAQNEKNIKTPVDLNHDGNPDLWVKSPAVIPVNDQPIGFNFTMDWTQPIMHPIKLYLVVPETLDLVSPGLLKQALYPDMTIPLTFTRGIGYETQTIQLINARTTSGWGSTESAIEIHSGKLVYSIPVKVESTFGGWLRRLGYNGQDNDNPLILLVPVIISIAGLWNQRWQQKEEQRKREDARRQKLIKESLEEFHRCIRFNQTADARQILERFKKENLTEYLKVSEQKKTWRLLNIAEGNLDGINVDVLHEIGVEEAAMALVYAVKHNPINRLELERILRKFPVNEILDPSLQQEIQIKKDDLGADTPVQFQSWPPCPEEKAIPQMPAAIHGAGDNPFAYERAEEDVSFLFRKHAPLFWSKHNLFKKVQTSTGLRIVTADPGAGKTAFALALSEYRCKPDGPPDPSVLACYLKGQPDVHDFRLAFARRFLTFIRDYPSRLTLLTVGGRNLLAEFLVQSFEKSNVLASLDHLSQPKGWKWLDEAKNDPIKHQLWLAETSAHLRLLSLAAEAVKNPTSDGALWATACLNCAQALGFSDRLELVIDVGDELSDHWLKETILENNISHRLANLNVTVLISSQAWDGHPKPEACNVYDTLAWNVAGEDSLERMFEWRWNQTCRHQRKRINIDDVIQAKARQTLVQHAHANPRCLNRIWNTALLQNPGKQITMQMVKTAKESIQCT